MSWLSQEHVNNCYRHPQCNAGDIGATYALLSIWTKDHQTGKIEIYMSCPYHRSCSLESLRRLGLEVDGGHGNVENKYLDNNCMVDGLCPKTVCNCKSLLNGCQCGVFKQEKVIECK